MMASGQGSPDMSRCILSRHFIANCCQRCIRVTNARTTVKLGLGLKRTAETSRPAESTRPGSGCFRVAN
jgi:hypothetical protein